MINATVSLRPTPQLLHSLAETIAWHNQRERTEGPTLFSDAAKRRSPLFLEEHDLAMAVERAAFEVVTKRSRLLADAGGSPGPNDAQPTGRLLLLLTDVNLQDGASWLATGGLIGELNFPPCDLWVGFVPDVMIAPSETAPALVCWIPGAYVERVQRGLDVNAEECLVWAEWASTSLEAARSSEG